MEPHDPDSNSGDESYENFINKNFSQFDFKVTELTTTVVPVVQKVKTNGKRKKRQCVKRKLNTEPEVENNNPSKNSRTRQDYEKLSKGDLNKLANRIQSAVETGRITPEIKGINPCSNKYKKKKKNEPKILGEQVPGTSFGKGAVGTVSNRNKYGVDVCLCCNDINMICNTHLPSTSNAQPGTSTGYEDIINRMSLNTAQNFTKNQKKLLHQESKLLLQPYFNESSSTLQTPLTKDKLDMIQKFMDSMLADRIDYEKPEQRNIVQGIDPSEFDSETKENRLSIPLSDSRTILERINYEKKRLSQVASLSQNEFFLNELAATSTPNIKAVVNNEPLPTYYNMSNDTILFNNEAYSNENNLNDFSNLDLSFVTMRTPLKTNANIEAVSSNVEESNNLNSTNVQSTNQESATNVPRMSQFSTEGEIMDLVNNLLGDERHTIDLEANQRFETLVRSDVITIDDTIDLDVDENHDIVDQSVIVIDEDHDVEVVESCAFRRNPRRQRKNSNTAAAETSTKKQKTQDLEIEVESSSGPSRICPICLEYLERKAVSATTCGHIFCTECITQSIKTSKKCPSCRKGLTLKKIHPLYLT